MSRVRTPQVYYHTYNPLTRRTGQKYLTEQDARKRCTADEIVVMRRVNEFYLTHLDGSLVR